MGFSLRNFLEEAVAQVNPFDQGKTASTVRAARPKVAPVQTIKKQTRLPFKEGLITPQQKANRDNFQAFKSGQIDQPTYQSNLRNILGIKEEKLGNIDQFVKNQADFVSRNPVLRPALTGAATLSPTNIGGNVAAYAGRAGQAAGLDTGGLTRFGDKVGALHQADPQGEFRNRGLGDSLIHGAIELAGDIVNPVSRVLAPIKYGTRSANDLARELEATGRYTPQQSFGAGTALGVTSGLLERTGIDKITGKAVGRGIRGVTTRLVTSGLTEGATEGAQEFAENLARNKLVDPNQSLTENVATSALVGGILGSGARGGVEVTNRFGGGSQQLQSDITKARQTTSSTPDSVIKNDPDYQRHDRNVTRSLALADQTTGKEKANFQAEAKESLRLRNARKNELSQKGFIGDRDADTPQVSKTTRESIKTDNKLTYPKVPTGNIFANDVGAVENVKQYDGQIDSASKLPTQEIPLNKIVPTQKSLTAKNLEDTQNITSSKEDIIVIQQGENYYVVDGHHRMANAILDGEQNIKTKVIQSTPQVSKTPKPTLQDALDGKSTKLKVQESKQPTQAGLEVTSPQAQTQDVLQVDDKGISSRLDDTTRDFTNEEASRPHDQFDAVAVNPKSKSARKLVDVIQKDTKLTKQVRQAQLDGRELNFFAKKDADGRSVGIEQFNPKRHTIQSGLVIDENNNVLGNHIKVDETGMQVNVGGEPVNISTIVGNPQDWNGNYRMMETMDRNIQRLAPDEATYRRTRRFTIDHKIKAEAVFRKELSDQRTQLSKRTKSVMDSKPRGVNKTEYKADIFDYIENTKSKADLKGKYDTQTIKQIDSYKKETRKVYDTLLDRVNETFAKFGEQQVPRRKDYLTHINELSNRPSFAGEMYGRLQNTILGEGQQTSRGTVPADIAGRTGEFKPRKRWNSFFQQRKGGEFTKDPFKAVDAYIEPTLYNIHMTESAVRARTVESAFRTAEEIRNYDKDSLNKDLVGSLDKFKKGSNSDLVTGFQEYANALTGKTQRLDRVITDSGVAGRNALKAWQTLQRVGGRATILGNVSSIISQGLNQPLAIASAGPKNYMKGVASSITGNTPQDQSNFLKARSTDVASDFRSKGQKVLDAGGVPLQAVELAFVKQTWNAEYHKAIENGFKGTEAVMEADRATEQTVAGRGIADRPEAYRSTVINGMLQYTLEVSASNKKFWQDLTPTQRATYVAATFAANSLVGLAVGYQPLPDYLRAVLETAGDFGDEEDERSVGEKTLGGVKRIAGETASMNPATTATANALLSREQRKSLFGDDSDLGRFEGTAAPVQVIKNVADATKNLAGQEFTNARNSALRVLPFGNQARKSLTGAEAVAAGHAVDRGGNPTFPVSNDPASVAQNILFGPSSTSEASNFYNNNQSNITGKADLEAIAASGDKRKTVKEIQERRAESKANPTSGKVADLSDSYAVVQDAFRKSGKGLTGLQDYSPEDVRKAVAEVNNDYRALFKDAGLPLPGKFRFDTNAAQDFVSYSKSQEGKTSIDKERSTNTFFRNTYKKQLDNDSQSFYKLGDDNMRTELRKGTISREQMDEVIRIDNLLTSKGLQKYPQVGKILRRELGYGLISSAGSSGRSSGRKSSGGSSRKGKKLDFSILGSGKSSSSISSNLRKLLQQATL